MESQDEAGGRVRISDGTAVAGAASASIRGGSVWPLAGAAGMRSVPDLAGAVERLSDRVRRYRDLPVAGDAWLSGVGPAAFLQPVHAAAASGADHVAGHRGAIGADGADP